MPTSAFLESFSVSRTAPAGRCIVSATIDASWAIHYVHGGIVMASLVHAATLGLDRGDLELVSASATFCRPVPHGEATIEVTVLRDGRNAAQVSAGLFCVGDGGEGPNAVATVVLAAPRPGWPAQQGPSIPPELVDPPDGSMPRLGAGPDGQAAPDFFESTDWRAARQQPPEPTRRLAWCSLRDPALRADGTWVPSMLAVPGDSLGLAAVPTVAASGPVITPSLHISMHVHGPARGRWVGIDSRCDDVHDGLVSGSAALWDCSGSLVATTTQTALLRPVVIPSG